MTHDGYLVHAVVYLAAAVLTVPLAKRLGLGSVLGYLIAGAAIGPYGFGLVGSAADVMHVAEFGVVMMLFLVGLELQPALLWKLRGPILGLGGLQVVLTALAVGGIGAAAGLPFRTALAVGLIAAMSSTAIVLTSLQEKGLLKSAPGQASFSVLLFQDIAVIPILAVLPWLAVNAGDTPAAAGRPAWEQALWIGGAVLGVVALGRFLVRPVFRFIAASRLRETFTAAALLLVAGIALLMQSVGLSAALGTFLAGVLLADSEYRHELESDIEPFKGLLLGLFFLTVGAGIDFGLLQRQPGLIAWLVAGLVAVKFLVLLALGTVFRLETPHRFLFAFALAQGGEFAFVLSAFAVNQRVLTPEQSAPLVAAVALSMALTPLLFLVNERLVQPRFARPVAPEREPDSLHGEDSPVIIAGFGRFGHVVGRVLRGCGVGATVLDHDAEQVDLIRRLGLKVFYGDATRVELLHAAGAERARLFVIAIDNEERILELAETVRKHFPHLTILARASGRLHAYRLMQAGVTHVFRETLGSSLDLAAASLRLLGMRGFQARRVVNTFRRHDEEIFQRLAPVFQDEAAYVSQARQHIETLDQVLRADRESDLGPLDTGWEPMPPPDREAAG